MSLCRSCDARIIFVPGYRGPVNPEPILVAPLRAGSIGLTVVIASVGVVTGVQRCAPGEPGRVGYVSHFSTCPQAAAHRKPREGGSRKPSFDPTPRPKAPPVEQGSLFPVKPFGGPDRG